MLSKKIFGLVVMFLIVMLPVAAQCPTYEGFRDSVTKHITKGEEEKFNSVYRPEIRAQIEEYLFKSYADQIKKEFPQIISVRFDSYLEQFRSAETPSREVFKAWTRFRSYKNKAGDLAAMESVEIELSLQSLEELVEAGATAIEAAAVEISTIRSRVSNLPESIQTDVAEELGSVVFDPVEKLNSPIAQERRDAAEWIGDLQIVSAENELVDLIAREWAAVEAEEPGASYEVVLAAREALRYLKDTNTAPPIGLPEEGEVIKRNVDGTVYEQVVEKYITHKGRIQVQVRNAKPKTKTMSLDELNKEALGTIAEGYIIKMGFPVPSHWKILSIDGDKVLLEDRSVSLPRVETLKEEMDALKPKPMKLSFRVAGQLQEIPLTAAKETKIGRDHRPEAGNDIVIDDPRISRQHASIMFDNGAWFISDLGSTGGTIVNGKKITVGEIKPGDTIQLGETTVTVEEQVAVKEPAVAEEEPKEAPQMEISFSKEGEDFTFGLVPGKETSIGRLKSSDIYVPDAAVSRNHAKIYEDGGRWFIEDVGSSSGTFVNGEQIKRQELKPGDQIGMGGTWITVQGLQVNDITAGNKIVDMSSIDSEARKLSDEEMYSTVSKGASPELLRLIAAEKQKTAETWLKKFRRGIVVDDVLAKGISTEEKDRYRFVDHGLGAMTMYGGGRVTKEIFELYERWKAVEGFRGTTDQNAINNKIADIRALLGEDNVRLDIRMEGERESDVLSFYETNYNLLKSMPSSVLSNTQLEGINLFTERVRSGIAKAGGSSFDDKKVYMYSSTCRGPKREYIYILAHELGHSFEDALKNNEYEGFEQLKESHKIIPRSALLAIDYALGPEHRKQKQEDFGEFIAETNMLYLTNGNKLRDHINSIQNPKVKQAWVDVYNIFKNNIYDGIEYSENPAEAGIELKDIEQLPDIERAPAEEEFRLEEEEGLGSVFKKFGRKWFGGAKFGIALPLVAPVMVIDLAISVMPEVFKYAKQMADAIRREEKIEKILEEDELELPEDVLQDLEEALATGVTQPLQGFNLADFTRLSTSGVQSNVYEGQVGGLEVIVKTPKSDQEIEAVLDRIAFDTPEKKANQRAMMRGYATEDVFSNTIAREERMLRELNQLAERGILDKAFPEIIAYNFDATNPKNSYLIMERIPGRTLESLIKNDMSIPEKAWAQVEQRVRSMNSQGYYHRDLRHTPGQRDNLIISSDTGEAILIDFGIAFSTETATAADVEAWKNVDQAKLKEIRNQLEDKNLLLSDSEIISDFGAMLGFIGTDVEKGVESPAVAEGMIEMLNTWKRHASWVDTDESRTLIERAESLERKISGEPAFTIIREIPVGIPTKTFEGTYGGEEAIIKIPRSEEEIKETIEGRYQDVASQYRSSELNKHSLRKEAAILKELTELGFTVMPKYLGHQVDEQNPDNSFLAMEKIDGMTLDNFLAAGNTVKAAALATFLREVKEINDEGYFNRDIKPDNVMVETETGRLRLIDFGIGIRDHPDYIPDGIQVYREKQLEIFDLQDLEQQIKVVEAEVPEETPPIAQPGFIERTLARLEEAETSRLAAIEAAPTPGMIAHAAQGILINQNLDLVKQIRDMMKAVQVEEELPAEKELSELEDIRMTERYQNQLTQTYSAVMLDIDGTLTNEIGLIDSKVLETIYALLRRNLPVVIVTGRPFSLAKESISDQIEKIHRVNGRAKSHIGELELQMMLKNLIIFEENGAKGRSMEPEHSFVFETGKDKKELKKIKEDMTDLLKETSARVQQKAFSIQINFQDAEQLQENIKDIQDKIDELGLKYTLQESERILDIVKEGVDKGLALEEVARHLGIDVSKILKVGDSGLEGGNDYPMLSTFGGFSVGNYDPETPTTDERVVLPVITEEGTLLTEVSGTNWLLDNLKFEVGEPFTTEQIKERFPDQLKTNPTLEETIRKGQLEEYGIPFGETSHDKILEEIYPNIETVLDKDIEDMIKDFEEIGASRTGLESVVEKYHGQAEGIAENSLRRNLEQDVENYINHVEDVAEATEINAIFSFERDMDVMTTGLRASHLGDKLKIERIILTRNQLGGDQSNLYYELSQILLNARDNPDIQDAEGDLKLVRFRNQVLDNILKLYDTNKVLRNQIDDIYAAHVEPVIGDSGNILLADVGFRGTMQYLVAAIYQRKHPGKTAFIDLIYTKPSGKSSFQGYTRSLTAELKDPKNPAKSISNSAKERLFLRHNADDIPRLLVESTNGDRAIREVTSEKDLELLFESLLRLKYGQNAGKAAASQNAIVEGITKKLAECS